MGEADEAARQPGAVLRVVAAAQFPSEGQARPRTCAEGRLVSFLLDTNVVSEWTKPYPNPGVVGWLETVDEDRVYLSVVTLVELRYGIERLAVGKKRKRLEEWL